METGRHMIELTCSTWPSRPRLRFTSGEAPSDADLPRVATGNAFARAAPRVRVRGVATLSAATQDVDLTGVRLLVDSFVLQISELAPA